MSTPHLHGDAPFTTQCGQAWTGRTVHAQSVFDARTCYYCRLAWERRLDAHVRAKQARP